MSCIRVVWNGLVERKRIGNREREPAANTPHPHYGINIRDSIPRSEHTHGTGRDSKREADSKEHAPYDNPYTTRLRVDFPLERHGARRMRLRHRLTIV